MAIGPHKLEYEVIEGWEQMPEGWSFVEVAGGVSEVQEEGGLVRLIRSWSRVV